MEEKSNPAKSIFQRMQTLFLQLPDRLIFFLLNHYDVTIKEGQMRF
jgi:hypothetical protein